MTRVLRVDATGARAASLAENRQALDDRQRAAFGADLSMSPQTPQAQWSGIAALALTEAGEAGVRAMIDGSSVDHADGAALDAMGSLLDITRQGALRSRVQARLAGVPGTVVPKGARARTEPAGDEFRTTAEATLAAGGVTVEMEAVNAGPVRAARGTLTGIVTVTAGWETVTNTEDASEGRDRQATADFRRQFRARTAHSSTGPVPALEAALIEAGATKYRIAENRTSTARTVQTFSLAPHSIMVIADGGLAADLTRAVENHRGMGVGTMAIIRESDGRVAQVRSLHDSPLGMWDRRTAAGNPVAGEYKLSATEFLLNRRDKSNTDHAGFINDEGIDLDWRLPGNVVISPQTIGLAPGDTDVFTFGAVPGPNLTVRVGLISEATSGTITAHLDGWGNAPRETLLWETSLGIMTAQQSDQGNPTGNGRFSARANSILLSSKAADGSDIETAIRALSLPGKLYLYGYTLSVTARANGAGFTTLTGTWDTAGASSRYGNGSKSFVSIESNASRQSITFNGTTYSGIDFTGDGTVAASVATLQTAMAGSGLQFQELHDRITASFSWDPDNANAFADGETARAFGLAPGQGETTGGPFSRPVTRPLAVSMTVTRQPGFPGDGLQRVRAAVAAVVAGYGIGDGVWANDLLCAAEAIPGTRVSNFAVTWEGTAVSGQTPPLDALYTLAEGDVTVTIA